MRAGRWEILGSWLRVWTPPRDVEVPPPPSRRTILAGLATLVACAAVVAFAVAPRIDAGKDERAAREDLAAEQRRAKRIADVRESQRPRFGHSRAESKAGVVLALEAAITRDATARAARGELEGRIRETRCEPHPPGRSDPALREHDVFECLALVRAIVRGGDAGDEPAGRLGYPFRAVVDFATGRWAFCRISPPPGETAVPDPADVVELPRVCRTPDR